MRIVATFWTFCLKLLYRFKEDESGFVRHTHHPEILLKQPFIIYHRLQFDI